jgi:ribonuclease HI
LDSQHIEIYTDGSCHTQLKSGAWASVILFNGERIVLKGEGTDTTHNRMELLAVIESIKYSDEKQFKGQLNIYTDSQYVCHLIERKEKLKRNAFFTSKGNLLHNADLLQVLIQQIESHTISFVKVKAHQKTNTTASTINSEVDKLSRQMVREMVVKNKK